MVIVQEGYANTQSIRKSPIVQIATICDAFGSLLNELHGLNMIFNLLTIFSKFFLAVYDALLCGL